MKYKIGDFVKIKDYPEDYCINHGLHVRPMKMFYGMKVQITEINSEKKTIRASGWHWNWDDIDYSEPIPIIELLSADLFEIDWGIK